MKIKKWSDMKTLEKVLLFLGLLMAISFVVVVYKVMAIPPSME